MQGHVQDIQSGVNHLRGVRGVSPPKLSTEGLGGGGDYKTILIHLSLFCMSFVFLSSRDNYIDIAIIDCLFIQGQ